MNIAIDMSPLRVGHFLQHRVRGTGLYLENLKKSLEQYYPKNKYIFFTRGEKLPKNVDIVHYPYFEPFFLTLPFRSKEKFIVTVHDLIPLVFPGSFPSGFRGKIKWQMQKFVLKKASAIITDSNSSKNDIERFTGISKNKIHVVYLAAEDEFEIIQNKEAIIEDLKKKYNLPDKFILYVGDATWNKNLPTLIRAAKKIAVPLVLVGKAMMEKDFDKTNPWNQDLLNAQKLIENDKNIFALGFVNKDDLILLYNAAAVFAMPSLYEGFGLPILEAMSCGCPVVTTKEGSLQEIAGTAAFYVDGYSVDSIASGMKKVFSDEKLQRKLTDEGFINIKRFSWKKTAVETFDVYKKILEK